MAADDSASMLRDIHCCWSENADLHYKKRETWNQGASES